MDAKRTCFEPACVEALLCSSYHALGQKVEWGTVVVTSSPYDNARLIKNLARNAKHRLRKILVAHNAVSDAVPYERALREGVVRFRGSRARKWQNFASSLWTAAVRSLSFLRSVSYTLVLREIAWLPTWLTPALYSFRSCCSSQPMRGPLETISGDSLLMFARSSSILAESA